MQASSLFFDRFELDLNCFELRKAGRVIRLERMPMELLILLIEKRGQLVAREQIIDRLWGNKVHVDSRQGINTAIRKLRIALRDNSQKPRLLQTVRGRGYRFLVPVSSQATTGEVILVRPGASGIEITASTAHLGSDAKPASGLEMPDFRNGELSKSATEGLQKVDGTVRRKTLGDTIPPLSPTMIRSHLERVLESPAFRSSASLARFLRYTVEAALWDEQKNLKEYVIGVEVFNRGENFDPSRDPIVRVQARKLREKLDSYYLNDGAEETLRIEFRKGGYIPSFAAGKLPVVHTIAILPFTNLSPENDSSYFCDGLTEELIHVLTGMPGVRVVARTSSFQFRNTSRDIREIGRALNAELLLDGSVRLAGEQLRVTVRLASACDGMQLWSGKYERRLEQIFKIQDEIANAIVSTVQRTVESIQPSRSAQTLHAAQAAAAVVPLEAMRLYLKGRHYWNWRTSLGFHTAIECFEQAIALEPGLSRAHAGIADAYVMMMMHNLGSPLDLMPKARSAALAALNIDPASAQAHSSLAAVYGLFDWNLDAASVAFQRAIDADPDYPTGYHWRSLICDLPRKQFDCALARIKKAERLDPLSIPIANDIGFLLYWSGRLKEAEEQCNFALQIDPKFYRIRILLGRICAARRRYSEALDHLQSALRLMDGDAFRSQALGTLGFVYGRLGHSERAEQTAEQLKSLGERSFASAADWAIFAMGVDDFTGAIHHLEEAARQKVGSLVFAGCEPLFNDLHADPRFIQIERNILNSAD